MDLAKTIQELYAQKRHIDRAIAALEELHRSGGSGPEVQTLLKKGRRGRTFMGPEERREVSKRMKAYWAARRNEAS